MKKALITIVVAAILGLPAATLSGGTAHAASLHSQLSKSHKCKVKGYHGRCAFVPPGTVDTITIPGLKNKRVHANVTGMKPHGIDIQIVQVGNLCGGKGDGIRVGGTDPTTGKTVHQYKPPITLNKGKILKYDPATGKCSAVAAGSISGPGVYVIIA